MKKIFSMLLIMTAFSFTSIYAHPHMLLMARLEFEYEGESCDGVWVDWAFDSMFSASILDSYDWDYNGTFDADEIQSIHDYAFINLENYGYFLSIREGQTRRTPDVVSNFSARQEAGQLFYRFFVPFGDWDLGRDFSVSVFDPTYFCAVKYQEPPILVRPSSGASQAGTMPKFELAENKEYPVYYDPMGGVNETGVYDKWKPGLETAYPEEAHVWF